MAPAARLTERTDRTGSLTGVPVVSVASNDQQDVDELARKLLLVAVIRVIVVTLSLGALFALVQVDPPTNANQIEGWQYVLVGTTYGLSIVYAAALRYRRAIRILAYTHIGLDALIVSVLVLMTGGVESVFGFAYVFPILGGSVTLYRRGGNVAAVVTILMFGTIVGTQILGVMSVLPTVQTPNALLSYALHSVGMAVVAVLSSQLAARVRDADRALAEKQVDYEQLQELHAAILRSLPAGLLTVDAGGVIRYANDSAVNILRSPLEALLGQPLEVVVPDMRELWERWRADPVSHRDRQETTYQLASGARLRLGYSFAPLSLQHGHTPGSIVVFQDVTDIVMLKEAVERAERLATVGKFAAGLAHEVRNPLASMCASIDVLASTLEPPEALQRLMNNVVDEADRLNRLITDFLALSRPRTLQLEKQDLASIVSAVLDVFANEAEHVRIERSLDEGVETILDQDLVRQVLWNLLRNASDALRPEGGTLRVRVFDSDHGPALVVADDGKGMAPEQLRRIFDPFYTTKSGGSGLGLAISHSIAEAHGAQLTVDSVLGEGTKATVLFRPSSEQVEMESTDLYGSDDVFGSSSRVV